VPLANEEESFDPFIERLKMVIDVLLPGKVYIVADNVSKDNTLELCKQLEHEDPRFQTGLGP